MRPLTVITGIVAGSSLSISVSLAAVLLVYLVLGTDHPRVQHEFGPLVASLCIFLGMTAVSAASFYTLLINQRFRFYLQIAMWLSVAGVAWYYVP